jgi:transposase
MRRQELRILSIIQKLRAKEIKQIKAADVLGLSVRQVRRIAKRVQIEGPEGVIHKARGAPSKRKLSARLKERVLNLYQEKYDGFGPTLANEKLAEIDKIKVSAQSLRNWLIEAGLWEKRRKIKQHRQWRERKTCFGEMLQLDGSHHDWLEGRGPKLVLMAYIDDATSNVFARFYDYEGTVPALDSFKRYVKRYGCPQSVYADRHSTYKSTAKPSIEDELNGQKPQSQFERALAELGVKVIHAYSPQAKGRVERLFGTLQDRLVKEMRLKGVRSKEEANVFLETYLPRYNERFSVSAASRVDLHCATEKARELDQALCLKAKRVLRNDLTISYEKKVYQLLERPLGKRVEVRTLLDGEVLLLSQGVELGYKIIEKVAAEIKTLTPEPRKTPWTPSPLHPWREYEHRF